MACVKAYPNISQKYGEVVCVAGIRTDLDFPAWVRLWPVGFRDLPFTQRFKKYDRIQVEARPHTGDTRPETFKPNLDSMRVVERLDARQGWAKRRPYVEPLIAPSMCEIARRQERNGTSLGVVRPGEVLGLTIDAVDAEWEDKQEAIVAQPTLLFPTRLGLEKIPYRFRYRYRCADEPDCPTHHQSIIDWEIAEAFRRWRVRYGVTSALKRIREKWLGSLCSRDRETMFYVGSQHLYPSKFLVLGVWWPPRRPRLEVDDR